MQQITPTKVPPLHPQPCLLRLAWGKITFLFQTSCNGSTHGQETDAVQTVLSNVTATPCGLGKFPVEVLLLLKATDQTGADTD